MLQWGWWAPWGEPGPSAGGAAGGSTHRRWEPRWGPRGAPSTQPGHDTGHRAVARRKSRALHCGRAVPAAWEPLTAWHTAGNGVRGHPPSADPPPQCPGCPFPTEAPARPSCTRRGAEVQPQTQGLAPNPPPGPALGTKAPCPAPCSSSHLTPAATLRFSPRTKKNPQSTFCI